MPASDAALRRYLVLMATAAALALGGTAVLNLAMDPYSTALGRWYRLRPPLHDDISDRAPDLGTAARINPVARSRAPVLLLGTSRTQFGFSAPADRAFNAGQAAAAMDDMLRIAEAAARRPYPPVLYVVEASSRLEVPPARARTAADGWPEIEERLLARESSHVSLHLLGHSLGFGRRAGMREDFYLPLRLPPEGGPR